MIKRWLAVLLSLLWLTGWTASVRALEPFTVNQYVTDRAGLLAPAEAAQLAQVLYEYAQSTGNQLLVITIPSLEGREPVEFTEALFELNQPGQQGKDNGLIFFVAKQERKIRIEVGYGLEEAVPDGKAGTIIRQTIAPRFKTGDFSGGIFSGVHALIQAITPGYQINNLPEAGSDRSRSGQRGFSPLALIVAFLIIIFSNLFHRNNRQIYRRYQRGYSEPGPFWGGSFPYRGWPGGSSSGDSGGFRGGSGRFRGGGGSFGGGGASGDW